jgi:hypothetical protein
MKRGSWSALAALGLLLGCASEPEYYGRSPLLPEDATQHAAPPTPPDASEDDALENWKSSVLDRADAEMLDLIRKDLEARLKRLQEWDTRLSYLPPGIALEERSRIAARISFEKKRLSMAEAK